MKTPNRGPFILAAAIFSLATATLADDPPEQPQVEFTPGAQGTFNVDWQGVAGRTYFTQFSLDLISWYYAPFIDFGDDSHHRGVDSTSPRLFLRLAYADVPGVESLEDAMNADFSGDGLSNIFKVTHGYDPFKEDTHGTPDALADPDQDGLTNLSEQALGTHPHRKDNPAVKLSVVVGN